MDKYYSIHQISFITQRYSCRKKIALQKKGALCSIIEFSTSNIHSIFIHPLVLQSFLHPLYYLSFHLHVDLIIFIGPPNMGPQRHVQRRSKVTCPASHRGHLCSDLRGKAQFSRGKWFWVIESYEVSSVILIWSSQPPITLNEALDDVEEAQVAGMKFPLVVDFYQFAASLWLFFRSFDHDRRLLRFWKFLISDRWSVSFHEDVYSKNEIYLKINSHLIGNTDWASHESCSFTSVNESIYFSFNPSSFTCHGSRDAWGSKNKLPLQTSARVGNSRPIPEPKILAVTFFFLLLLLLSLLLLLLLLI